jgi:hypothetical protein
MVVSGGVLGYARKLGFNPDVLLPDRVPLPD